MIILGINAYHGDVSAVLLRDGELVLVAESPTTRTSQEIRSKSLLKPAKARIFRSRQAEAISPSLKFSSPAEDRINSIASPYRRGRDGSGVPDILRIQQANES